MKDRCVLKLVDLNAFNSNSIQRLSQTSIDNVASKNTWHQLKQSNFIEPTPLQQQQQQPPAPSFNEYYSSPIMSKIQSPPSNCRYNSAAPSKHTVVEAFISSPSAKASMPPPPVASNCPQQNHRSLSEPRPNPNVNPYSQLNSQEANTAETYDNLNEAQSAHRLHHSRIDSKFNSCFVQPDTQRQQQQQRDLKSVDRDLILYSQSPNNHLARKINTAQHALIRNNSNIMMGLSAKQAHHQAAEHSVYTDLTMQAGRSRSESLTPRRDEDLNDQDLTENDLSNLTSYVAPASSSGNSCTDSNNNARSEALNELDERDIEQFETSKMKMKLMQQQLETLTELVHKALVNRDLNQLAEQSQALGLPTSAINGGINLKNLMRSEHTLTKTIVASLANGNGKLSQHQSLSELNAKTKLLRQDLMSIRKLHETFNLCLGDSMKSFISQLNVNKLFNILFISL